MLEPSLPHTRDSLDCPLLLPWTLSLFPLFSFLAQYYFSRRAGTLNLMLHHPTVTYVDWIFIPFNYFVAKTIDWSRGLAMYIIWSISLCLVIATHAMWQIQGIDPGHMISKTGVVLGAGWVHIVFSTLEMVLLVSFVFCRRPQSGSTSVATGFALLYFISMLMAGYIIHHRLILSDICVFISGIFFLLVYPLWIPRRIPS